MTNLWEQGSRGMWWRRKRVFTHCSNVSKYMPFFATSNWYVTCQWIYLLLCLWNPLTGVGCLCESFALRCCPSVIRSYSERLWAVVCMLLLWKGDTSNGSYTVLRSAPSFPCAFWTASSSLSKVIVFLVTDVIAQIFSPFHFVRNWYGAGHGTEGMDWYFCILLPMFPLSAVPANSAFLKGTSKSFGDGQETWWQIVILLEQC